MRQRARVTRFLHAAAVCMVAGALVGPAASTFAQEGDASEGSAAAVEGSSSSEGSGADLEGSGAGLEGSGDAALGPLVPTGYVPPEVPVISAPNLDEDPDRALADDMPVALAVDPVWVPRPIGRFVAGIGASERDSVNLLLGAGFAVTRWDERGEVPTLHQLHRGTTRFGELLGSVEIGLGDDNLAPWLDTSLVGARFFRSQGASDSGFANRFEFAWGQVRVQRNLRILRGLRLEATGGSFTFRTVFAERTNVATHIDIEVGYPGYSYVSPQGRADAFHGLQLARLQVQGGPRFGPGSGPWVQFVGGGWISTAVGAELGPTATFRTDMSVFAGLDALLHERVLAGARVHYDAAQDSYRRRIDGAWRVTATIGTRF